jgi:tRNA modification GTPase
VKQGGKMSTIVALSTVPGRSAIGVVRLSGPGALGIARTLIGEESFTPDPGRVTLRAIKDPERQIIDRAILTYFKAPNSFTGEDVVELSCHGAPIVLRQIIDLTLRHNARLAEPGEFTLRAVANGKINLSQAEAIRDLISAQTDAAARNAVRQLGGELSKRLGPTKEKLLELIVTLESAIDFVEDDLPELQIRTLASQLDEVTSEVQRLSATYETGHLVREGLAVTIVGRPNVGKSSLFNSLLNLDRAIVTEIPGTTRDSLSESISIDGVPIRLTDTAGVHDAQDSIEKIGIERTRRAMADADLLLVVLDGVVGVEPTDLKVLSDAQGQRHVVALNKCDLPEFREERSASLDGPARVVKVSAVTGEGLAELQAAILEPFGSVDSEGAEMLISDSRHFDLLCRAEAELKSAALSLWAGESEELTLVGLHNGLRFLGEITGETTPQEILTLIFSTFCIGK